MILSRRLFSRRLGGLGLLAACLPASCFALAEFGRGLLTLETSTTATYDSYFIGSVDHDEDWYATFRPQFNFSRNAGLSTLNAFAGIAITRYDIHSRYDSEDFFAGLRAALPSYEGARLTGGVNASYTESTEIDQAVNDRIPTRDYNFGLNAAYQMGLKTALNESFQYSNSLRDIYSDQEVWSNRLGFSYSDFLENTRLTLSHEYVRTDASSSNYASYVANPEQIGAFPDSGLDQTSNTYNIGLSRPLTTLLIGSIGYGYRVLDRDAGETSTGETREQSHVFSADITGPFLPPARFPKVDSSASLAYQSSTSPGLNDSGNNETITGAISLSWEARARTEVFTRANRSLTLSSNNLTVENTSVSAGVTEQVGLSTTLSGTVSYLWQTYRGVDRDENTLEVNLSARRPLSRHWNVSLGYTYQDVQNDSADFQPVRYQLGSYTRHVASFSITAVF